MTGQIPLLDAAVAVWCFLVVVSAGVAWWLALWMVHGAWLLTHVCA